MCRCVAGAVAVHKSQIQSEEEELQELWDCHSEPVQGEEPVCVVQFSLFQTLSSHLRQDLKNLIFHFLELLPDISSQVMLNVLRCRAMGIWGNPASE